MDWGAVATIVVAIAAGAAWIVIELTSLKRDVHGIGKRIDHHSQNDKAEHQLIWSKIDSHGDRITKLEAGRHKA